MFVTYFDEVKSDPNNGQHWYFVGGVAVPAAEIRALEDSLNNLAVDVFGTQNLTKETEFHGSHIYHGKGAFRKVDARKRIDLLIDIAKTLADASDVRRIYAAIDTTKLYAPDKAAEFAFAHFCERAQRAIPTGEVSLLIGDRDDQSLKSMIADFQKFRRRGTPWAYGIDIDRLVDSVHFAQSHHSRMIQLADVYLFLTTHSWGSRKGWLADELSKRLAGIDLHAHRYKAWPSANAC